MKKSELIAAIAASADLTKASSSRALEAALDTITHPLKSGDSVTLIGFGTFKVSQRAARIGRNPQTGKELKIAVRKAPTFTAGKALKEAVNE